jgi:hypothetical protein
LGGNIDCPNSTGGKQIFSEYKSSGKSLLDRGDNRADTGGLVRKGDDYIFYLGAGAC